MTTTKSLRWKKTTLKDIKICRGENKPQFIYGEMNIFKCLTYCTGCCSYQLHLSPNLHLIDMLNEKNTVSTQKLNPEQFLKIQNIGKKSKLCSLKKQPYSVNIQVPVCIIY